MLGKIKKIELNASEIIEKRNEIAREKNLTSNATYGWFRCFKKINFHGESADVDPSASCEWLSQLKNLCEGYNDDCIYNIDETALFYQQQRGVFLN